MSELARLILPALRWRSSTGYEHENRKIEESLRLGVGGFIIFGGAVGETRRLISELQTQSRHPLLIGSDFERGGGQQLEGLTQLPAPAALGFIDEPEITRRCGDISAQDALSVGITWLYAPVADLDIEPQNPIIQSRSFGVEPLTVSQHVAEWVRGAERAGVVSTAKHFPGHGRTVRDSHETLPVVRTSFDELQQTDLVPFHSAVEAGVRSIMVAHVAYPAWDRSGKPATLSRDILSYLRHDLNFDGVIVTDALIMEGVLRGGGGGEAGVEAVAAGCDVLLYPPNTGDVVRSLESAVPERVTRGRLDEALHRVAHLASLVEAVPRPERDADSFLFADSVADLAVHVLRGDRLALRLPIELHLVDDDVGGPYAIRPRDVFERYLESSGVELGSGGSRVVLIYSEPRSWKGRAMLGARSLTAVERLVPEADLVVLFGHPRLLQQIPGDAVVLVGWHGQSLMQEAAARWVVARLG